MGIKDIPNAAENLMDMVTAHYDCVELTQLAGEITFDDELSTAEVDAALRAYAQVTGRDIPSTVYLPMAGPLRHVLPLLESGVRQTVAVDLSQGSFNVGLERFGDRQLPDGSSLRNHVAIHCTDIRNTDEFMPEGGFDLAISLGNSFGDVTDLEGHKAVMQAMADALTPGGVFVFDYVGTRYNPPPGVTEVSVWDDHHIDPITGVVTPVRDTRTRTFQPIDDYGNGILRFTCQVDTVDEKGQPTGTLVPLHPYEKLTLTEEELKRQFAEVGLRLLRLDPITEYSEYHKKRNAEKGDLGMMGEPNHLYIAIKDDSLLQGRNRHASAAE